MKISLYQPCNDGTYHTIPDNMLVSNPEYFYPASDYEALEAELAALVKEVKLLHNTEICKTYRFTTTCKLCEVIAATNIK